VEQILLSHINGYSILLPPINYEIAEETVLDGKPIHIVTDNQQIIDFLSNIDNGEKSKLVKEILLFYIRESRDVVLLSDGKKKRKKQISPQSLPKTKPRKKSFNTPSAEEKESFTKKQDNTEEKNNSKKGVETEKEVVIPPINEKPKEKNNSKSPMMQALFKMSGDE
jgi:hypothetical protein